MKGTSIQDRYLTRHHGCTQDKTRDGWCNDPPRPRTTGRPKPRSNFSVHGGGTLFLKHASPPKGCIRIRLNALGKPSYREPR